MKRAACWAGRCIGHGIAWVSIGAMYCLYKLAGILLGEDLEDTSQ